MEIIKTNKVENEKTIEQLVQIYNQNNQGYLAYPNYFFSEEFEKYICIKNKTVVGYLTVYHGKDFLEKEDFKVDYSARQPSLYIWAVLTKNGNEGQGIATSLITSFLNDNKNKTIYSVIDELNLSSKHLHKKFDFKSVSSFKKFKDNKICFYNLYEKLPDDIKDKV